MTCKTLKLNKHSKLSLHIHPMCLACHLLLVALFLNCKTECEFLHVVGTERSSQALNNIGSHIALLMSYT